MTGWNHDMAAAPKDGTLLQLLVKHEGDTCNTLGGAGFDNAKVSRTMGFNNYANDGKDRWYFPGWCWCNDRIVEQGYGTLVAWALMLPLPVAP